MLHGPQDLQSIDANSSVYEETSFDKNNQTGLFESHDGDSSVYDKTSRIKNNNLSLKTTHHNRKFGIVRKSKNQKNPGQYVGLNTLKKRKSSYTYFESSVVDKKCSGEKPKKITKEPANCDEETYQKDGKNLCLKNTQRDTKYGIVRRSKKNE